MAFGDVCLLFGTLLSLGIAIPGLLVAWWLLCPRLVERAGICLVRTPGRCFGLGLGCVAVAFLPLAVLFKVRAGIGLAALCTLLACASIGAAGLAGVMGDRLRRDSPAISPVGALLGGAVALELAAVVPLIGWFVVLPLAFACGLGAACFALVGWHPRTEPAPASLPVAPRPLDPPTPALPITFAAGGLPTAPGWPVAQPGYPAHDR